MAQGTRSVSRGLLIGLMLLAGPIGAAVAESTPAPTSRGRLFEVTTDKAVYGLSEPILIMVKYLNAGDQIKFVSIESFGTDIYVRRATAPPADPTLAFTGKLTPVASLDFVSTPRPMPAPVYSIAPAESKVIAYAKIPGRILRPGVYAIRLHFRAADPFSEADSPGLWLQTLIEVR